MNESFYHWNWLNFKLCAHNAKSTFDGGAVINMQHASQSRIMKWIGCSRLSVFGSKIDRFQKSRDRKECVRSPKLNGKPIFNTSQLNCALQVVAVNIVIVECRRHLHLDFSLEQVIHLYWHVSITSASHTAPKIYRLFQLSCPAGMEIHIGYGNVCVSC